MNLNTRDENKNSIIIDDSNNNQLRAIGSIHK